MVDVTEGVLTDKTKLKIFILTLTNYINSTKIRALLAACKLNNFVYTYLTDSVAVA